MYFQFKNKTNALTFINYILPLISIIISCYWIFEQTNNYLLSLGGDPLIHLIFAKNLSNGYFFHFNLDKVSSAASSPIYVAILSLTFKFFGQNYILIPKIISLICFVSINFILFFKFKSFFSNLNLILLIILFTVFPPVIFQSLYGMENILFTVFVLIIFLNRNKIIRNKIFLFLIPFLIFLRPESVFFIFSIFCYISLKKKFSQIIYLFIGLAVCLFILVLIEHVYGFNNFSAGNSRRTLNELVPSYLSYLDFILAKIYFKPIVALFYLLPFLIIIIINSNKVSLGNLNFLLGMVLLPFLLHLVGILPNAHFPRYFFPSYTLSIFIFINILSKSNFKELTQTSLICVLILFFSILGIYRNTINDIEKNRDIPLIFENIKLENIHNNSLQISKLLGNKNNINIGIVEIQHKLFFKNNFTFFSLDGLINSNILDFNENKIINIKKFIINNSIDVLIPYPKSLGKRFTQLETYPSNNQLYNLKYNKITKIGNLNYEKKQFINSFDIPFIVKISRLN